MEFILAKEREREREKVIHGGHNVLYLLQHLVEITTELIFVHRPNISTINNTDFDMSSIVR